jgi:hypothetical protein
MVKRPSDDRGYCHSPMEAAAKVEAAWFTAVKRADLDAPAKSIR